MPNPKRHMKYYLCMFTARAITMFPNKSQKLPNKLNVLSLPRCLPSFLTFVLPCSSATPMNMAMNKKGSIPVVHNISRIHMKRNLFDW